MKKVILLAAMIVLAIVVMLQNSFAAVDTFTTEGSVLPNGKTIENLKNESIDTNKADIRAISVKADATLYSRGSDMFVGDQKKEKIDSDMPFFMKDGSAIRLLNNNGKLVGTDYKEEETYTGMVLSNGTAYNQEGQRSDWNEYYFLKVSTPVYINQKSIQIETIANKYNIPSNSICYFGEDVVRYYTPKGEKFEYFNLRDVEKISLVTMGAEQCTYYELQKKLGLVSSEKNSAGEQGGNAEQDINHMNNVQNGYNPINNGTNQGGKDESNQENEDGGEDNGNTKPPKPSKPLEPLPPIPPDQPEGGNPGGSTGNPEIPAPPEGALPPANPDPPIGGGEGETGGDPAFIMPKVEQKEFTPGVYSLLSKIAIDDPSFSLVGITYEIRREDGSLLKKASFGATDTIRIGGLVPDTTYNVSGSFKYYNAKKEFKTENFCDIRTIKTKMVGERLPLKIKFTNGQKYGDAIELVEFGFLPDCDEDTLSGVTKIEIKSTAEGSNPKLSRISTAIINKMKKGESQTVKTDTNLESNTEYSFEVLFYDSQENLMPVQGDSGKGTALTCKALPKAMIRVQDVGGVSEMDVSISNKDNTPLHNITLKVVERGTNTEVLNQPIAHGDKLKLDMLKFDRAYEAKIFARCDVEDGKGEQEYIIGQSKFVTASYDVLGAIHIANSFGEITGSSVNITMIITDRTNPNLMELVTKAKIVLKGKGTSKEVLLSEEDLESLSNKKEIIVAVEDLEGNETYTMSIEALAYSGEDSFNPKVNLTKTSFQTLKTPPEVLIKNVFTLNDYIEFDLQVLDPQYTVRGGLATIRIYEKSSQECIYMDDIAVNGQSPKSIILDKEAYPVEIGKTYTVNIIATQYNDNSGVQKNYQLASFDISTTQNMTGRTNLTGIEVGKTVGMLNAKIKVEINDPNGTTVDKDRICYLLIEKEGMTTEKIDFSYQGQTFTQMVEREYAKDKNVHKPYTVKLYYPVKMGGIEHHVLLDYFNFTTDKASYVISNEKEFLDAIALGARSQDVRYLVINNLNVNESYIGTFYGEMDFQGFSLTHNSGQPLLNELKSMGAISNLVYKQKSENTSEKTAHLVDVNRGRINNIYVIHDTEVPRTETDTTNIATITRTNYGTISNFVVELMRHINMFSSSGGVCKTNEGMMKNGYLFGHGTQHKADIFVTPRYISAAGHGTVGGLVGINNGTLKNVFILADMLSGSKDQDGAANRKTALIAGTNGGIISNIYSFGGTSRQHGPNFKSGEIPLNPVKNVYYVSDKTDYYINPLNVRANKAALHDSQWQGKVLNAGNDDEFNVDEMVEMNMFPQLKLTNSKIRQPLLSLPEIGDEEDLSITSSKLKSINEDGSQTITVKLYNPGQYTINKINVDALTTTVTEQTWKNKYTEVELDVKNPKKYFSAYKANHIEYATIPGAVPEIVNCNNQYINAEFFDQIKTVEQWKSIADRPDENFEVVRDLDFVNQDLTMNINFTGKIHGNKHTLKNIKNPGSSNGYMINTVSGADAIVKDIIVESFHMRQDGGNNKIVGLFVNVNAGATIDGVIVRNSSMGIRYTFGGIVNNAANATIKNCAVIDTSLKITSTTPGGQEVGGLVGTASNVVITNCFVRNVTFNNSQGNIGGLIGTITSGRNTIKDSYVVGGMNSISTTNNTGGIVGLATNSTISMNGVYSDVDIDKDALLGDALGIGKINNSVVEEGTINAISLGDLKSDNESPCYRTTDRYNTIGGYYFADQRVNGQKSTSNGKNVPLTEEDLGMESTYVDLVGFDRGSWDFSNIKEGILPRVKDTNGDIMPYQTSTSFVDSITYGDITWASAGAGKYNLVMELVHKPEVVVKKVSISGLGIQKTTTESLSNGTRVKLLCTVDKAWDHYFVDSVEFEEAKATYTQNSGPDLPIEQQWKTISNLADWNKISNDKENYKIITNIDFNSVAHNPGKNVGRLRGETEDITITDPKTNRTKTVKRPKFALSRYKTNSNVRFMNSCKEISGLTISGFINNQTAFVGNLRELKDCIITGGNYISPFSDYIKTIDNVYLTKVSGQYSILSVTCQTLQNVIAEDIIITARANNLGGLVVSCNSMNNIRATNIQVNGDTNCKAAIAYQCSGDISDIYTKNCGFGNNGNSVATVAYFANRNISDVSVNLGLMNNIGFVGGVIGVKNGVGDVTYKNISVTGSLLGRGNSGVIQTGGVIAQLAASGVVTAKNISVTGLDIKGSSIAGGIVGDITAGARLVGESITVDTCIIKANTAGGISATGAVSGGNIMVNNTDITAFGQAGGIVGTGSDTCGSTSDLTPYVAGIVSNTTIKGYDASGVTCGNIGGVGGWVVDNCTITATAGQAAGILSGGISAKITNCFVYDSTISGTQYVGGIMVRGGKSGGQITNCVVKNAKISGTDYVGGIAGETHHPLRNCAVLNTTVTGKGRYVGGIAGYVHNMGFAPVDNCYSDAIVEGNTQVGGIVGSYEFYQYVGRMNTNYFTGTVTGKEDVGGILGQCWSYNSSVNSKGVIFAGTLNTGDGIRDIFSAMVNPGKKNLTDYYVSSEGYKAWDKSTINGKTVTKDQLGKGAKESSPWIFAITAEEMKTGASSKISDPFYGYDHANFDLTQCEKGYMPILNTTEGKPLFPKTESGYGAKYYQGGAFIPTAMGTRSKARPTIQTEGTQIVTEIEAYAVAAGKMNIEFGYIGDNFMLDIKDKEGNIILEQPLAESVITLDYDYQTPLTITVHKENVSKSQQIEAEQLVRKAETYEDNFYYITKEGIKDKNGIVMPGEFVNLYKGNAQDSKGNIYSLTSKALVGKVGKNGKAESRETLFTFDYNGHTINTYGSFTESISKDTGESVINDQFRMVIKNGQIHGISNSISPSKDGFIYYEAEGKRYEAVLLRNGQIKDFGGAKGEEYAPLNLPEEFENSGIHQMTNNIGNGGTTVVIVYDDGAVLAFDFVTGQVKAVEKTETVDPEPFLSFIKGIFDDIGGDDVSGGTEEESEFVETQQLMEALKEISIHEAVKAMGTENPLVNEGDDAEMQSAESESNSRYLMVYVDEKNKYEIFEEDQLLKKNSDELKSQNEIIADNTELVDFYKISQPSQEKNTNDKNNGIVLYLVISVIIITLLSLVVLRRKND